TQKKFNYLNKKYNVSVTSEIKNRKADFILIKDNLKVINIEANFYKGGGSKPQEIVDSYINRQTDLYNNNFNFIWISDGFGWKDQYNQTTKAFNKIDYLLNLNFVKKGLLEGAIRFIYNI
ncbi:MAG: DpnII family type II restriction endonuclease, partial [archaeon]